MLSMIRIAISTWASRVAVFLLTFIIIAWAMVELPRNNIFWARLDNRFDQDQRYQIQGLFLPDTRTDFSVVIVGDSLFQNSLPTINNAQLDVKRITINGYEANDVHDVFLGFEAGRRGTKSEVCTIVLQISPVFAVRAKAYGADIETGILRDLRKRSSLKNDVRTFFNIFDEWSVTNQDMPAIEADAGRIARHVGQTRFSDPTHQNWDRGLSRIDRHRYPVILVLDTRGTDWGDGSDLVAVTRQKLDEISTEHSHVSWVELDKLADVPITGCERRD
jgi:hypothetical protein